MPVLYEKHIEYRFFAGGEVWALERYDTHDGVECVVISETRKNGQEDCHVTEVSIIRRPGESWQFEEHPRMLMEMFGERAADEILAFLNDNPPPEDQD